MRLRIPEIVVGALLTIAVFAMGMMFSLPRSVQTTSEGFWLTKDASGFFTFVQVIVGTMQAALFLYQLKLMRKSLAPAVEAAEAAKISATSAERTLQVLERPWLLVDLSPHFHFDSNKIDAFALFDIANHGRTVGIITECIISLGYGSDGRPDGGLCRDDFHGIVGPGRAMAQRKVYAPGNLVWDVVVDLIDEKTYAAPDNNQGDFFFYISIKYTDTENVHHESRRCWRYDRGVNYWVQFGDDGYNFQN